MDERRAARALEGAASVYPGRAVQRDVEATTRVLDAGRSEQGALGLLRFFAQLEAERIVHASRFMPTYLAQHPASVVRAASVQNAAREHRSRTEPAKQLCRCVADVVGMRYELAHPDYPKALRALPNPPPVLTTSGPLEPPARHRDRRFASRPATRLARSRTTSRSSSPRRGSSSSPEVPSASTRPLIAARSRRGARRGW